MRHTDGVLLDYGNHWHSLDTPLLIWFFGLADCSLRDSI